MSALLPLTDISTLLDPDKPFTPAMARTAGLARSTLERMHRDGVVRRVLRGVYVAESTPDSSGLRAAALRLVVGREAVVVDRTAGWLHGLEVGAPSEGQVPPLDTVTPRRAGSRTSGRQLTARDVVAIDGLRATTPVRTALDLARVLPPGQGLAALDQVLATYPVTHAQLLAELPRLAGNHGIGQLRTLAAQADERASGRAESELRLRWHRAELPTATPGLLVAAGPRLLRLALGVEGRRFGAVLADRVTADDLHALEGAAWRVVVLAQARVLHTDPTVWVRHLEREWHQHLLTGLDPTG